MLYIFHSSPLDRHRVTVVARYEERLRKFLFAYARCGGRDHFARKKGVMIASGRLRKMKFFTFEKTTKEDPHVFVQSAALLAHYLQKHSNIQNLNKEDGTKPYLKSAPAQIEG